jgi:peptidoglycan hydrolase-like protein with peptidoglycan-binding domain
VCANRRGEFPLALASLIMLGGAAAPAVAQERPVTAIECQRDRTPLALAVCADRATSAAERRAATAYLAVYFSLDGDRRAAFRNEHVQWLNGLVPLCSPPTGPLPGLGAQGGPAPECLARNFALRGDTYRKRLASSALEESNLPLATMRQLQKRLIELNYLTGNPDGMFGAGTRQAIRAYQASIGHPQGNFLTAEERESLLTSAEAVAEEPAARPPAPARLAAANIGRTQQETGALPLPSPGQGTAIDSRRVDPYGDTRRADPNGGDRRTDTSYGESRRTETFGNSAYGNSSYANNTRRVDGSGDPRTTDSYTSSATPDAQRPWPASPTQTALNEGTAGQQADPYTQTMDDLQSQGVLDDYLVPVVGVAAAIVVLGAGAMMMMRRRQRRNELVIEADDTPTTIAADDIPTPVPAVTQRGRTGGAQVIPMMSPPPLPAETGGARTAAYGSNAAADESEPGGLLSQEQLSDLLARFGISTSKS